MRCSWKLNSEALMEGRWALSALLALHLPLLAAGLHGEAFATKLAATPHEVVDFHGEQLDSPAALRLTVTTHEHDLVVVLKKHDALFAPGYEHIIIHPNGSVLSREGHGPNGHCIYRGHLFNASSTAPIGDALMSVCDGQIEGRLRIGETHDLVVAPHPAKDGRHAVFRRADFDEDGFECGVTDEEDAAAAVHDHHHHHVDGAHEATQRRRLITGNVDKYVELLIVNDKTHCDSFTDAGETLSDMTTRSAAIVAFMSALYASGYNNVCLSLRFTSSTRALYSFCILLPPPCTRRTPYTSMALLPFPSIHRPPPSSPPPPHHSRRRTLTTTFSSS